MAPTTTTVSFAASLTAATQNPTIPTDASATLPTTRARIILAAQTALHAPTLTVNPTPSVSQDVHKHLSPGAIAGLATVSVVAFLSICALVISLSVMYMNRRRGRRPPTQRYLREQGRLGPEREMRTTFDAPVLDLRQWNRMTDKDSVTTTTTTTVPKLGHDPAPGDLVANKRAENAEKSPSSPARFRMERPRSEDRKSFQMKWDLKGHKGVL